MDKNKILKNDIIIYSKDDLKSKKNNELISLMKTYSLKYSGLNKDGLISEIIQYQQHVNNLNDTLVVNNSIDKFHRGRVEYALPTMIIYSIIRRLWLSEISYTKGLSPNAINRDLTTTYRKLLLFASVSKELFNLVSSSLFTDVHYYSKDNIVEPFNLSIANPHSVMKNITRLTVSIPNLQKLLDDSSINLRLKFSRIVQLEVHGFPKLHQKYYKIIGNSMPKLERFTQLDTDIDNYRIFTYLNDYPSLTYLDIGKALLKYGQEDLSLNIIPDKIKTLKLPIGRSARLIVAPKQVSSNLANLCIFASYVVANMLGENLAKLSIYNNQLTSTNTNFTKDLKQYFVSDRCNLQYFYFQCNISFKGEVIDLVNNYVSKAKSINSIGFRFLHSTYNCYQPNHVQLVSRRLDFSLVFSLFTPLKNIRKLNIHSIPNGLNEHQHSNNSHAIENSEFIHYKTKHMHSCINQFSRTKFCFLRDTNPESSNIIRYIPVDLTNKLPYLNEI